MKTYSLILGGANSVERQTYCLHETVSVSPPSFDVAVFPLKRQEIVSLVALDNPQLSLHLMLPLTSVFGSRIFAARHGRALRLGYAPLLGSMGRLQESRVVSGAWTAALRLGIFPNPHSRKVSHLCRSVIGDSNSRLVLWKLMQILFQHGYRNSETLEPLIRSAGDTPEMPGETGALAVGGRVQ